MKKILALTVCTFIVATTLATTVSAEEKISITKLKISVDPKFNIPYVGQSNPSFQNGFKPGYGSAITLKSFDKDGKTEFFVITDRGPNGDGPNYNDGAKEYTTKIFPSPDFTPSIGILKVEGGKAEITETIPLKDKDGKKISGRPLNPGQVGFTNEVALDTNMKKLEYDNNGLDTEGIALDKEGNFWISDEYGPFVTEFDKSGKQLKKYGPGTGLPEILKYRTPNRGAEGFSISPSGKMYIAVQSVLDVNGETSKTGQFTRIVELDPVTMKTRTFAYPVDVKEYKSVKDAKIGDIFAVSDTQLLVIEQGSDKNKNMRNLIYSIDLADATDIENISYEGKALEYADSFSKLPDVKPVKKTKVIDLREYGWNVEKAEGICVLPDMKTIAIVNDNDLGMKSSVTDTAVTDPDIVKYVVKPDGSFTYGGKAANPRITIQQNDENEREPQLWLINLPSKVSDIASSVSKGQNPKTGDTGVSQYILLVLIAGVVAAFSFRKLFIRG